MRDTVRRLVDSPANGWRLLLALAAILYVAPLLVGTEYRLFVATQMGVYVMVAIGLNLLNGYGGQVSLGHGALVGIGAYAAALAMVDAQWSFWPAAALAMAAAAVVGAMMALPALRLSTWYFALVTLGFAQVMEGLMTEWRELTHGFAGVVGIPQPALLGYALPSTGLYWLVLTLDLLAVAAVASLLRSRFGRALIAVRDNPVAATASGVSMVWIKMFAFVVSAAIAGLAGALFAVQKTVITPEDFTAEFSIFFLLVVVLGGAGRLWGPVVGALVFFLVPELLAALQSWRLLIYGAALLVLMLYAPHGLVGAVEAGWKRLRARLGLSNIAPLPVTGAQQDGGIRPIDGVALSVRGVEKRFGGVAALAGVSLEVAPGTSHAIVGPNGSGKTTLLNMISGFYPVDAGAIAVGGRSVIGLAPHRIAHRGVGRTFQTPRMMPDLTVLDNILLGAFMAETQGALAATLRLPAARREQAQSLAEAMRYLDFVGLRERAMEPAGELPHGQQRLAEIARALVGRPRLLLLDEPAAGLSLDELDRLGELISAIRGLGTTVVIVEHHLELVANICSSVTVLERGAVLASGTPAEVFSNEAVISAYMGAHVRIEAAS
ncbi:branched-chain amino acid ABC transporter ATP-binding protein/permease [Vineibacter terrae]|uniref:Branched-chain amino acid ABC transporter ATP-binding protein/permease n=1 Tax=Vineibacter terrae TaxID=2586908 RepID=A0A5C8PQ66_9HYPH|nr:branched-chain amino acid ABC transporter ATP-binding protein/permease [Vineibacter terrae]TXL77568.1 branched-chain amino acid ABC transporter ATP-binding protein/permease [Vineibacter terrae]